MLHRPGENQLTQNIQINEFIGENENVLYFTEKTKWTFQQTQYVLTCLVTFLKIPSKSLLLFP